MPSVLVNQPKEQRIDSHNDPSAAEGENKAIKQSEVKIEVEPSKLSEPPVLLQTKQSEFIRVSGFT